MGTPVLTNVKETKQADCTAGEEGGQQAAPSLTTQEVNALLNLARAEAVAETEKRLREEYEARSAA
jgi:phage host-nuclease inhibitor protein Gam